MLATAAKINTVAPTDALAATAIFPTLTIVKLG